MTRFHYGAVDIPWGIVGALRVCFPCRRSLKTLAESERNAMLNSIGRGPRTRDLAVRTPDGQTKARIGLSILAAILLTACATRPPAPIQARVPDSLRANCEKPAPDAVQTVGDLAGFSLRQDAAIDVCNAKRAALVSIIDGVNQVVEPKRKRFGLF